MPRPPYRSGSGDLYSSWIDQFPSIRMIVSAVKRSLHSLPNPPLLSTLHQHTRRNARNREKESSPYRRPPTYSSSAYSFQYEESVPCSPSLSYSSSVYSYQYEHTHEEITQDENTHEESTQDETTHDESTHDESTNDNTQEKRWVFYDPSRTHSSSKYPCHNEDARNKRFPDQHPKNRDTELRHFASARKLIPQYHLDSVSNDYRILLCLLKIFGSRVGQHMLAGTDWGNAQRTPEFRVTEGDLDRRKIISANSGEVQTPQKRQEWKVSIVYNTWTLVKDKKLGQPLEQLLAHWGLCFTPSNGKGLNRVYSMDFEDELGFNLALQTTWWTGPEDGWVEVIYDHEMNVVERKHRCSLATMHFSEAELAVTAQKVLDAFLDYHYNTKRSEALRKGAREFEKHCKKHHVAWNAGTGRLYSLLSRNCQDYAIYLFDNLLHQGWCDKTRMDYDWDPQVWLQVLDHIEWLEVPRSKKWGRVGKLLKEAGPTVAEEGIKASVAFMLSYELMKLLCYGSC